MLPLSGKVLDKCHIVVTTRIISDTAGHFKLFFIDHG